MTTAEAKRHDLYNALVETIGADHTDTLMTYLPSQDGKDLVTRSDFRHLSDRMGGLDENLAGRIDTVETNLTNRIDTVDKKLTSRIDGTEMKLRDRIDTMEDRFIGRIDAINQRLDRLALTLVAGLVAILATLISQTFT